MSELPHGYRMVVGLEVHVELNTATKLFCGCPNHFGDEPNTNVCPVCLGLPGSMPVLNGHAMELAMRLGRALRCEVRPSVFARKNYFYPDMPKDYQVSQYDQPVNVDGFLDLPDGTRIGIERAHVEEDTGKSTHVGGSGRIHEAGYSLVDYNRSGVPLVEIVSRPDIRTLDQAREYVSELRAVLVATDVSDARMEEGSMRVDANVSVHQPDTPLGTRCEIKNLNSIRSLGRAIEYEALRQVDLLETGERVVQQTRHWDEADGRTHRLRSKEEAEDYRYFPEPDLVPHVPEADEVAAIDAALPRLPAERRTALAGAGGRTLPDETVTIVVDRGLDEMALGALEAGADADKVLNHLRHDLDPDVAGNVSAEHLAALVAMETSGTLTSSQAKQVLADMGRSGKDPETIAGERGFEAMDTSELESMVDEAIEANPDAWAKYRAGEQKAQGAIIGHVMRATKGQADGKLLDEILQRRKA